MKITGNTYEWKKQLAAAGFTWNSVGKSWDRAEELELASFGDKMIANGIESGDLLMLICDLGDALRDVHDFCEPSTHHRYINDGLRAMQRASALLQEIGM